MINNSLNELESGKCIFCNTNSWIYVLTLKNDKTDKTEKFDKDKIEKLKNFVCMPHYKELLKKYLEDKHKVEYDLFPEDLPILDIPYKEGRELIGMTSPKIMLLGYIEYLDKKIARIDTEMVSFKGMDISEEDHLFKMIIKEKLEKEILKLISQIQLNELK